MAQIKFGTDGWRGVIAEDFTDESVRKVAYAIARYVVRAERAESGVIVGYDTRFASERFARVAAEAVAMTGMPSGSARTPVPRLASLFLSGCAGRRAAFKLQRVTIPTAGTV